MSVSVKAFRSSLSFVRIAHAWTEWRAVIVSAGLVLSGLTAWYLHQWTQWQSEVSQLSRNQAREIRELTTDLRTARQELRARQAQNDLLATRRLLALARQALDDERIEDAQVHLGQASSFLKAVSPLTLDVNAARLDRLKSELLLADLRLQVSPRNAADHLTRLTGELDGLLGQ